MKRTGDWGRKKPLPRTGVARRGALVRQSAMTRTAAARKPAKRDPAEAPARKLLRARSGDVCELHGDHPASDAHHRQNRSQGGEWAVPNLLHICHALHMQITVNPALAYERGWSVRSTQNPASVPVWLAGRGWSLLAADGSVASTERRVA